MRKTWIRRQVSSTAGTLLLITLFGLPIWGIIHSFVHHGATRGLVALIVPPFAAYEGVAFLWETPKWERDWADRCELLGAVVLKSIQDDTDPPIIAAKSTLKKWLSEVPESRRAHLRVEVADLGATFTLYWNNVIADLAASRQVRSMSDESLGLDSSQFMNNPGLAHIWGRWVEQEAATQRAIESQVRTLPVHMLSALAETGTPESERALELSLAELFGNISN